MSTHHDSYVRALVSSLGLETDGEIDPATVVDFAARVSEHAAWVAGVLCTTSSHSQVNMFFVEQLLELSQELLLVAADDMRARTTERAA